MILDAKLLLAALDNRILEQRKALSVRPNLSLIWIGDDAQTAKFIRAKQQYAKQLDCDFSLHHFSSIDERHLHALVEGLNAHKNIHGIVIQLPLPDNLSTDRALSHISLRKDIDGLCRGTAYIPPTPMGIITLLQHYSINLAEEKTCILGAGRLVGGPLAKTFSEHGWPFTLISRDAQNNAEQIRSASVLISCTGVSGLVKPEMVHKDMVVVDGSGIDVDVKEIEPRVRLITPSRGAVGPLTVRYLFSNLLSAAARIT